MELVIFSLGAVLFLLLSIVVVYWFLNCDQEDYFYPTVICVYVLATIVLLYHLFGGSVFGIVSQGDIVFCVAIAVSLFLILYTCIYILLNHFRVRLLLLLPPLALQFWQVIGSWHIVSMEITSDWLIRYLALFSVGAIIGEGIIFISRRNKRRIKSDLLYTRFSRSNFDLPFDIYIHKNNSSGNVSDDICFLVVKLYQYAKSERLSPKRLDDILSRYEEILSPAMRNRVHDRFLGSHYLNRMETVNLLEFAMILFPEFFGSQKKAYSSENYNLRLFEEFYVLSQNNINRSQAQLHELTSKVGKIEELLLGTSLYSESRDMSNKAAEIAVLPDAYSQSVIREIFHLTKTPLLTINAAVKNLSGNQDSQLSEVQKEKLSTIVDNVLTVKLIIEAYRKLLTVSEVSTSEAIVPHIKTIVTSTCNVYGKQITPDISNFPERVSVHGNNVIIILLMPLIHNAIEASPNKGNIVIRCTENDDNYIITVENTCEFPPKQSDLNIDGYSTKNDGGEGLRSVRRISKSIGIEFKIKVYNKSKKVVAALKVPKK